MAFVVNIVKAKLSIVPSDTKQDDFVLALVDYFHKEFTARNLSSNKKNSYVKVALSKPYMSKYDSVIVDCVNGKLYLRGKDCNDRYYGRLSKFNCKRASDAYHCVNYNATRIVNRIKKLENYQEPKRVARVVDLRQKRVADLRTEPRIIDLRHDVEKKIVDMRSTHKVVADLRTNLVDAREENKESTWDEMKRKAFDSMKTTIAKVKEKVDALRNTMNKHPIVFDFRKAFCF